MSYAVTAFVPSFTDFIGLCFLISKKKMKKILFSGCCYLMVVINPGVGGV